MPSINLDKRKTSTLPSKKVIFDTWERLLHMTHHQGRDPVAVKAGGQTQHAAAVIITDTNAFNGENTTRPFFIRLVFCFVSNSL